MKRLYPRRAMALLMALILALGLLTQAAFAAPEETPGAEGAAGEPVLPPPPSYSLRPLPAGDGFYPGVTGAVTGTVQAAYRVTEGYYYVILEAVDHYTAALVKGVRRSGRIVWLLEREDAVPATEASLNDLAAQLGSRSNLTPDYSALSGGATVEGVVEYLTRALNNMDGITPNDPAKAELATFLAAAVTTIASGTTLSPDNRLKVDAGTVAGEVVEANRAWDAFAGVLEGAGVELNRAVELTVRLLWSDLDASKRYQVSLDQGLSAAMDGVTVQLLLGDGQHGLRLVPSSLEELEGVTVQIARNKGSIYTLTFLDQSGQVIPALEGSITVTLPAATATSTVVVAYGDVSENWGGQYDPNAQTVTFDTSYSGTYEVRENDVDIRDIDGLSEEARTAVEFLVSRGYMNLEGGAFRPDAPLNRYDFTKALVGMFYALDWDDVSTFPDVPEDSPYYYYVASGETQQIVRGLGDGTFGGEKNITLQELLTMCGRTLAERKGYVPPLEPSAYLNRFTDSDQISDWAMANTALAIREQLLIRQGALRPQEEVTRAEAAEVLYRLFRHLYEVPPVELMIPREENVDAGDAEEFLLQTVAVISVAVAAVVVVAGVAVVLIVRKKRRD